MKEYIIVCDDALKADLLFGRFLNMILQKTRPNVSVDYTRCSIRINNEMYIRFLSRRKFDTHASYGCRFEGTVFDGSIFELYLNKNKKGLLTNVT